VAGPELDAPWVPQAINLKAILDAAYVGFARVV
jgi:hypothetical protein